MQRTFFLRRVPAFPLSHLVESIWYGENAPPHRFERYLPTGEVDLIINVHDAKLRRYEIDRLESPQSFTGPIVSGAHCRSYVIDTAQQAGLLGVKFRSGHARQLLGIPLDHLGNQHLSLAELWGSAAFALQEAASRGTPEQRLGAVERFLTARMLRASQNLTHPGIVQALRTLVETREPFAVAGLVEASGLSARRFIEVFRRDVGMPPKRFWRVLRFRRALRVLTSSAPVKLTALALEHEYYDQPHFIRDFREFAGVAPRAYRATAGAYDNHLPVMGVKSVQV